MHDSFRFQLSVILLWMRLVSKWGGEANIKDLFCSALKLPRLCGISLVNQVSLVLERSRWRGWTETGVKTAWQPADIHRHFVEIIFTNDTFSRKDTSISPDTEVTEPLVSFRLSSSTISNKAYMLSCTISYYNAVSFSAQNEQNKQKDQFSPNNANSSLANVRLHLCI